MEKAFLQDSLAKGMSLDAIGELAGKHPSTVSYWLKKHGLRACGAGRHSPKGAIDVGRLRHLVDSGSSIREIAAEFGVGYSTVRYWLRQHDLVTDRSVRLKESEAARREGLDRVRLKCPKHGYATFFSRPDGGFRCGRCNSSAVSAWRRRVKRQIVQEAGGKCVLCGFDEHQAALQFHHVDPSRKSFHLSERGLTRAIAHIRDEAKKCVLLCANCHAQVEAGVKEVPQDR